MMGVANADYIRVPTPDGRIVLITLPAQTMGVRTRKQIINPSEGNTYDVP